MASQNPDSGPDKRRSTKWRNQLSDLYQLIAEHVDGKDPKIPLPDRLTSLLSSEPFISALAVRLAMVLAQIQTWTEDPDAGPMKDRILAVVGFVPMFPTTRAAALVPFLESVYHFSRRDDSPLGAIIEPMQQLIADERAATPNLPTNSVAATFEATPLKAKSTSPYSACYTLTVSHEASAGCPYLLVPCVRPGVPPVEKGAKVEGLQVDAQDIAEPTPSSPQYREEARYPFYTVEPEPNDNKGAASPGTDVVEPSQPAGAKKQKKDNEKGKKEEEQSDWKRVLAIVEIKCEKKLTDLRRKVVLQLAGYARQVFHRQPDRLFVHGFSIINSTLHCWLYTRSGAFASSSVDLKTAEGMRVFCRVFNGYLSMNAEDLGSATPLDNGITTVGDFAIVRDKAFFTTHALVTCGTTCWAARPLVGGKNKTARPMPWILKVAWRYPARKHEGTILSECQALKVQGIADYIAHDEGKEPITVHGILGKRCVESAVALDLRWKRNERPLPTLHRPAVQTRSPNDPALMM